VRPAVEVPKVAAQRKEAERSPNETRRPQRFLRLTSSRLAFYLGQTGIQLNALIKLLTSFGPLGGHRVSAGPRVGPFLPRRPSSLSFLSRHFGSRIVTRTSTIGISCDRGQR